MTRFGQVEDEHRRVGRRSRPRDRPARRGPPGPRRPAAAGRRRRGRARRTAAAGGGPRAGGPRRRGSRAAPCSTARRRRSPRTPIARARVSVSASTREPTTRIVPADPTSRPPDRSSPSVPGLEPARASAPPRATIPRMPRPAARIVIPTPGPDLADDPGERRSRAGPRRRPCATRQRPCHWKTYSPAGPRRRRRAAVGPIQRPPGRGVELAASTECSSSRGSRSRSAIGAPTTTESPAATSGRSPGASGEDGVDRRLDEPARRRTRRTSEAVIAVPSRRRPPSATTRAARRAGRPGPAAAAARRAGRPRSPPRPPVTSIAKCRPRAPSRTVSRNCELGHGGRCPAAGRSSARPPGIRSSSVEPPAAPRTTTDPALRPGRIPAGVTNVPSGASRSSTRSATIARRSSASGIDPSGARIRAWSSANWPAPGRRRTSARARATVGRGRDGPGAAGRDDEVGRRAVGPLGRRIRPAGRARRGRRPSAGATPSPVASAHGRDPQLAHPVAQAVAVGAPGRPLPDPVDDRVVGLGRGERGGRDDRQVDDRRPRRRRPARPRRARPGVVADLDDLDAPVEDLGQGHGAGAERPAGVVRRQGELDEQVGQRRPPGATAAPPGRAATSPARVADVAERGQVLGHPAGQDDRQLRPAAGGGGDERGQLAERPALVGGRRVAGPDQDRR